MAKGTVNRVILVGNVGKDPEVKRFDNGNVIANLSLATSEARKDKEAVTEWHKLVFFGKLAEIVEKWVKKGHKVYVEGKIQTRKWENKEGVTQYTTEIIADQLQMLGGQQDAVSESAEKVVPIKAAPKSQDFFDDDIPF